MPELDSFEAGSYEVESKIDVEAVRIKLAELRVGKTLIRQACKRIRGSATGVLLYGSCARGDASAASDLDLLLVAPHRADSGTDGKLSINCYSPKQFADAGSTLFGMHLARDGIVLHDTDNRMAEMLSEFTSPNAQDLLGRIRDFSIVLELPIEEQLEYLSGLCQVARYLLRSAIYAAALGDGNPCFSVAELADRFNQPELTSLLSSHPGQHPEPSLEVLDDLKHRLRGVVGTPASDSYESLHALIIGSSISDPDLEKLATLALGVGECLPYAEIPKVIL